MERRSGATCSRVSTGDRTLTMQPKTLTLLPPAPGRCQECGIFHEPAGPHNPDSLFYQVKFFQEHERYPTWADALAHCTPDVQARWRAELAEHGIVV